MTLRARLGGDSHAPFTRSRDHHSFFHPTPSILTLTTTILLAAFGQTSANCFLFSSNPSAESTAWVETRPRIPLGALFLVRVTVQALVEPHRTLTRGGHKRPRPVFPPPSALRPSPVSSALLALANSGSGLGPGPSQRSHTSPSSTLTTSVTATASRTLTVATPTISRHIFRTLLNTPPGACLSRKASPPTRPRLSCSKQGGVPKVNHPRLRPVDCQSLGCVCHHAPRSVRQYTGHSSSRLAPGHPLPSTSPSFLSLLLAARSVGDVPPLVAASSRH